MSVADLSTQSPPHHGSRCAHTQTHTGTPKTPAGLHAPFTEQVSAACPLRIDTEARGNRRGEKGGQYVGFSRDEGYRAKGRGRTWHVGVDWERGRQPAWIGSAVGSRRGRGRGPVVGVDVAHGCKSPRRVASEREGGRTAVAGGGKNRCDGLGACLRFAVCGKSRAQARSDRKMHHNTAASMQPCVVAKHR